MMTPIYHQFLTQIETEIKDECITVAKKYHIEVNEEGLIQALTNARKFYDEGYADGQRDSVKVVRCKDCVHYALHALACRHEHMNGVMPIDGFCSYGERRSHHDSLCDQNEEVEHEV